MLIVISIKNRQNVRSQKSERQVLHGLICLFLNLLERTAKPYAGQSNTRARQPNTELYQPDTKRKGTRGKRKGTREKRKGTRGKRIDGLP